MGTDNQIGGTVHGPAVQAGSIHGGVHFHLPDHSPRPDGQELPDPVRMLLWAQVQAALDLPYRLAGAKKLSLATLYVRQDPGKRHGDHGTQTIPSSPYRG